jgi:hypothetical protein
MTAHFIYTIFYFLFTTSKLLPRAGTCQKIKRLKMEIVLFKIKFLLRFFITMRTNRVSQGKKRLNK